MNQIGPDDAAGSGAVLKTLLLTDLVGSTRLIEDLGDRRAFTVLTRHDTVARDLLPRYGGREIDKTDGFLLLFERPVDAVRYALAYHRALAEMSEEPGVELAARAGIHLGEVYTRDNPPEAVACGAKPLEVEGLAKPAAARIMSLAGRRQTLLTQGAFDLARRAAKDTELAGLDLGWVEHGLYAFKGIDEPVRVFEVGEAGFAPLEPPPDSAKVRRLGVGDGGPRAATSERSTSRPTVASDRAPAAAADSHSQSSRSRNRRLLAAAAAVLLVVTAAVLARFLPRPLEEGRPEAQPPAQATPAPRLPQGRVAVLPFDNRTGDPSRDALGRAAAARIWGVVAEVRDVDPVPMAEVEGALAAMTDDDPAMGTVQAVGAGIVVSGSYLSEGDSLRVQIVVLDGLSGHPLPPVEAACPAAASPSACLDQAARRAAELVDMQAHVPELLLRLARLPSYEAYRAYHVEGDSERGLGLDPAVGVADRLNEAYRLANQNELAAAAAMARELLEDKSLLSAYGERMGRGALALFELDYLGALGHFREARRIEPSSRSASMALADVALAINRPGEVVAAYDGIAPCDALGGSRLTQALHLLGEFERELDTARQLQACLPRYLGYVEHEARALAALGRLDDLEEAVAKLLVRPVRSLDVMEQNPAGIMWHASRELRAHGYPEAAQGLAERAVEWYRRALDREGSSSQRQCLLAAMLETAGGEHEAAAIYRDVLAQEPGSPHVLVGLGVVAARMGDRAEAERIDGVLAGLEDRLPFAEVTYYRARIAACLGEGDRAVDLIQLSLAGTLPDYFGLHIDEALASLRSHPEFQAILRPKG